MDTADKGFGSRWQSEEHNRRLASKGKGPMAFTRRGGNASYGNGGNAYGGVTIATLTFNGIDTFAGSLIDGRYALTVDHTKVTANGTAMAADFRP